MPECVVVSLIGSVFFIYKVVQARDRERELHRKKIENRIINRELEVRK